MQNKCFPWHTLPFQAHTKTKIIVNIQKQLIFFYTPDVKATYILENSRTMITALDSIREEILIEDKDPMPSRTYYSIYRSAHLIPYDSAIFLSTDSLAKDLDYKQQAAMLLLKKRIRVSFLTDP